MPKKKAAAKKKAVAKKDETKMYTVIVYSDHAMLDLEDGETSIEHVWAQHSNKARYIGRVKRMDREARNNPEPLGLDMFEVLAVFHGHLAQAEH